MFFHLYNRDLSPRTVHSVNEPGHFGHETNHSKSEVMLCSRFRFDLCGEYGFLNTSELFFSPPQHKFQFLDSHQWPIGPVGKD